MYHANSSIWLPSFLGTRKQSHRYRIAFFFTKVLLFFVPDWTRAQYLFEPFELYKKTQGLLNEVRFLNWKKIKFLFFVTTQVRRDAEKETLFFLLFGLLLLFFFCSLDRRGKEFNNLFNFHDSRWRKRVDFWLPMKRHWPVVLELKSQPAFRYYY